MPTGIYERSIPEELINKLNIAKSEINKRNELGILSRAEDIGKISGIDKGQINVYIRRGLLPSFITKEEAVIKYLNNGIENNSSLKNFKTKNVLDYLNHEMPVGSKARIDYHSLFNIVKKQKPELFETIFSQKGGTQQLLLRNPRVQDIAIKDYLKDPDLIKKEQAILSSSMSAKRDELRILEGKLKLGPRDFAISQAQDNYVKQLNENIKQQVNEIGYDEFVKRNPTLIEYAGKRLDSKTGQIIQRTPEELQKYINDGFFSIDHKNKKSGEKINIEFPTNKQIVPAGINSGYIRSAQSYLKNNLDNYGKDPIITKNIDSIIDEGKKYNFTIGTDEIPNYQKSNLAKIFKGVKNIGGLQFPTVTENVLTGFDEQLKPFNFDTSNVSKVLDIPTEEKFVDIKKGMLGRTQRLAKFVKAGKYPLLGVAAISTINATPSKAVTTTEKDKITKDETLEPKLAENISYNPYSGFVKADNPEEKASQSDLLYWIADNEIMEDIKEIGKTVGEIGAVIGGATVGLGLPDVKKTVEEAKAAGKSPVKSVLGKGFYRLGSPFATAAFTIPQALDEKVTATEMATDPLNYLGLATMETLGKRAGTIAAPAVAESSGILGALKNYATLKNVGEAVPGKLNAALRLGLSPRVIAGASRFLGIPGLIASGAYTLYDYLSNKESE
jgi:hypothetical protein